MFGCPVLMDALFFLPSQKNGGKGWFGGFLKKFRGKNDEMILPDDKNPAVSFRGFSESWKT